MLFSGTLRSNLDPFDEADDATLYDALRRAQLYDTTGRYPLDLAITEEGQNLSEVSARGKLTVRCRREVTNQPGAGSGQRCE